MDTPQTVMTIRAPAVLKNTQAQIHPTITRSFFGCVFKASMYLLQLLLFVIKAKSNRGIFHGSGYGQL